MVILLRHDVAKAEALFNAVFNDLNPYSVNLCPFETASFGQQYIDLWYLIRRDPTAEFGMDG